MAEFILGSLTEEQRRAAACDGKVNHESHAQAQLVMRAMIAAGTAKLGLNSYDCDFCGGVHIGSSQRRRMVRRLWFSCQRLRDQVREMFVGTEAPHHG